MLHLTHVLTNVFQFIPLGMIILMANPNFVSFQSSMGSKPSVGTSGHATSEFGVGPTLAQVAHHKGVMVAVKKIDCTHIMLTRDNLWELNAVS